MEAPVYIAAVTIALLLLSLFLNAFLYRQIKKLKTRKDLATDARELLHYLTRGGALLRITVIDPEGIMLYRGAGK